MSDEILLTAKIDNIGVLVRERGSTYGHPSVDFARLNQMTLPLADMTDLKLRHVAYMIMVKLSRLIETPEHDESWVDIAGYTRTAAMIIDKRRAENIPEPGQIIYKKI